MMPKGIIGGYRVNVYSLIECGRIYSFPRRVLFGMSKIDEKKMSRQRHGDKVASQWVSCMVSLRKVRYVPLYNLYNGATL